MWNVWAYYISDCYRNQAKSTNIHLIASSTTSIQSKKEARWPSDPAVTMTLGYLAIRSITDIFDVDMLNTLQKATFRKYSCTMLPTSDGKNTFKHKTVFLSIKL